MTSRENGVTGAAGPALYRRAGPWYARHPRCRWHGQSPAPIRSYIPRRPGACAAVTQETDMADHVQDCSNEAPTTDQPAGWFEEGPTTSRLLIEAAWAELRNVLPIQRSGD
ncbi:hypothetical protein GCM10023222_03550 [Saccharopolyspora cebuensis]